MCFLYYSEKFDFLHGYLDIWTKLISSMTFPSKYPQCKLSLRGIAHEKL